jgi:hypothetical protein
VYLQARNLNLNLNTTLVYTMFVLLRGVLLAAALLPGAVAAHVKQLTAENFQKSVLESSDLWLIEFASPTSFILEENMEGLPKKLAKSGVRVGSMDCDDKPNLKFCRMYGYRGSYALTGVFEKPELNPYTKKKIRKFVPFAGSTTPRGIEKFISKGCPNLIPSVTTRAQLDDIMKVSSNTVVIFTEKENPTMFYKTLAVRYAKYPSLKFAHINSANEELMESFPEVTEFPAAVVVNSGDEVEESYVATAYDGDMAERQEILDWIAEFAGDESDATDSDAGASDEFVAKLKDLGAGSIAYPMSQVVAVVRESAQAEVPNWAASIEGTDSAVEFREVRCSKESAGAVNYNAICAAPVSDIPYLLVLPYGADGKKAVSICSV